jgi:hypothetical protein
MSSPAFQTHLQFAHREGKRARIAELFSANLGRRLASPCLHLEFGSSFRARVSEINADPAEQITIRNEFYYDEREGKEISHYWAEPRVRHLDLG